VGKLPANSDDLMIRVLQKTFSAGQQKKFWTSGHIHAENYGFDVSGNLELTIQPDFACLVSFLMLIKTS